MPAPPEILHRRSTVWLVEVAREGIAQQGRDPDGHVRIGREVAVDLDRIAIDGKGDVDAAVGRGIEEDRIDQIDRDLGGDDRLLEQAPDDQQQAPGGRLAGQARGLVELGQQVRGPHNRTGHQMREEAHQQHDVQQALGRRCLAAMDVHDIADALEGEEADPDRQQDLDDGDVAPPPQRGQQVGKLLHEEAVVFECPQDQQIGRDAQDQQPFAPVRHPPRDHRRNAPVQHRRQDQQGDEPFIPLGIEEPAGQQQEDLARPVLRTQRPGREIDDQEEDREGQGREQHSVCPGDQAAGWAAAGCGRVRPASRTSRSTMLPLTCITPASDRCMPSSLRISTRRPFASWP